jgi:hypothetical protein
MDNEASVDVTQPIEARLIVTSANPTISDLPELITAAPLVLDDVSINFLLTFSNTLVLRICLFNFVPTHSISFF